MDSESIRIFLAVVDTGSITGASKALFTAQSSISRKITQLEEEVGTQLIIRNKGQSFISLTAAGEKFLESARQLGVLYQDIETISRDAERQYLSLGAVEAAQTLILKKFCPLFIHRHPEICLSIHSYHTSTIFQKINDRVVDIGFVSFLNESMDMESKLFLECPFVVITRKDNPYSAEMTIGEFPAKKELYLRFNAAYEIWHNHIFPGKQYMVRVSREMMFGDYLAFDGTWAVISRDSARILCSLYDDLIYYPVTGIPYSMRIYGVVPKLLRPSRRDPVELFRKEISAYLDSIQQ